MKKVTLGKTGEQVSKLGFGVSGPHGSQMVGRSESVALIRKAIAAGYTVFDTAPAYGDGEAESRLGLALKEQDADALFIMTKAGVQGAGMGRKRRDFSPDAIELSLQDSLRRFALGHADALFLHGPAAEELTDGLLKRLDLLRSVGGFRFLGICGRGAELDAGIDSGVFDLLMAPCPPDADETQLHRFERANKAGMGTFAIETMRGLKRIGLPKTGGDVWYAARQLRSAFTAERKTAPVEAEAALRTALERTDVDVVMTSTTRADNLAANAALAGA